MANEPEFGTPDWYNAIARRAVKRIVAIATPVVKQSLQGGYAGGSVPVKLATLKKMPIPQAVGFLQNMMTIPSTRAAGVGLFAKYLSWLEQTGQLAPGAGKRLQGALAAGELSGRVI